MNWIEVHGQDSINSYNFTSKTHRMRVDGGFLYRIMIRTALDKALSVSLVFVPDSCDTIMNNRSKKAVAESDADAEIMKILQIQNKC